MPFSISLSQTSLAIAILASTMGTYIALSPPNPSTKPIPSTGDLMRRLNLTNKHFTKFALTPLGFLALQASSLACFYPNIPQLIIRNGTANGLNPDLITWSRATSIPLALVFCVGIPLRLVSYASLGKNFTFALAEPDTLKTTGIYHYVQHPSYTGVMVLVACNMALLGRMDGALTCWIPPVWYKALRTLELALLIPAGLSLSIFGVWTRVRQEERMLRARFGAEWESWHARTPRFIPWIF
ncbi:hypothetical protein F4818DRAFT_259309 [Hypoxylon cercidicola]|nr:hypothetical protein F4818DRAFT_259309 [Hypoxylon cercidicola]